MHVLNKHRRRIAITLIPLLIALAHTLGWVHLEALRWLDDAIYDARLRASMPRTLNPRIAIVDIDEKSLNEIGRWPWGRNRLAQLVDQLFARQHISLLGFDVVFAEPDESSGLKRLNELARTDFRHQAGFAERLRALQPQLDYDALFAKSLRGRPVVLGYYFTSDREGHTAGVLPQPVMDQADLRGGVFSTTSWNGYGANMAALVQAAPKAGYFNSFTDGDGVVRSVPLLSEFQGKYYESLSLSMFRLLAGEPRVLPGYASEDLVSRQLASMDHVRLQQAGGASRDIAIDGRGTTLVPFRGPGGPSGGSFQYVSASDVLLGRLAPDALQGKIVLVGTTAPGLLDLRATPVAEVYPGVEVHANMLAGFIDGHSLVKPDYAVGFEAALLLASGLLLAFVLPLLSALRALLLSLAVLGGLVGLNFGLYLAAGLVLPLAAALCMVLLAYALNMSYGYFVESRSKRELAHLFGTYVPPELVDEMVKDPDHYSMQAQNCELTVMFCDMRGFTKMSESMEPTQLQALLTGVFSQLTALIRNHRGTIDKYMGDCVMAFWGAPVRMGEHAQLAVQSALDMAQAMHGINADHRSRGLPEIGIGIGLNTGMVCVGDMGSNIRRAYTVIGDAVNLGSRLEGLSKVYGVEIVVSESTRLLAPNFAWQELDRVRVKGKKQAVAIFWPAAAQADEALAHELALWARFLEAYRAQQWPDADALLQQLLTLQAHKYLYQLYLERVASLRQLPYDAQWDGATNFETK